MLKSVVKLFGGDPNKRAIEENIETVNQINALEDEYEALSNEQLRAKTEAFRGRLGEGERLEDILVELTRSQRRLLHTAQQAADLDHAAFARADGTTVSIRTRLEAIARHWRTHLEALRASAAPEAHEP